MFKQNISKEVWGGENGKYRLRTPKGDAVDKTPEDNCRRVAKGVAEVETSNQVEWENKFYVLLVSGKMSGGGRITANIGSGNLKRTASPINCVLSGQIADSMRDILQKAKEASLVLQAGCGIGYDFSTIRPKGAYVFGAGSKTSGVLSFMKIYDASCSTVMSGGSRRGAQLACLNISHPEIEEYIKCKRQDGMFRYFNLSIGITDEFMSAVENDEPWHLWFWERTLDTPDKSLVCLIKKSDHPYYHSSFDYFSFDTDHVEVLEGNCGAESIFKKRVFKTMKAKDLFELIMKSTYDFAEPGMLFLDEINNQNVLGFCEKISSANPCGEQILPPSNSCLLGSMILSPYVSNPFDNNASFDWKSLEEDIRIACRFLDNVVELNNLPLKALADQIKFNRRHGLGFTGLGTTLNLLGIPYGSDESLVFTEDLSYLLARVSLEENVALAKEKGPAIIFEDAENRPLAIKSGYMSRLLKRIDSKELESNIMKYGLRYSHATSIAPTGTMSLTWGNNCSNGIEPSFSNSYLRNIRTPGKNTKTQEEVMSLEFMMWKDKFGDKKLPDSWRVTDDLTVEEHLAVQAVAQKWIDSAISKTINVPTDYDFNKFKEVYMNGWKLKLKGLTTFRFNPDVFTGVLVRKEDLEETKYIFILDDGSEIEVSGADDVEYDGDIHNAANLYDALKEGMYGDM